MEYPIAPFVKFRVREKGSKIIIAGQPKQRIDEKIGTFGLSLIGPAIFYYFPVRGGLLLALKVIAMILAFFVTRELIKQYIVQATLLTLEKNMLTSNVDKFHTDFSDIKDIKVVEEAFQTGENLYRLKFTLSAGKKTSVFAFTSFNTAEELLNIIKNSSEK
jgi:hypothetical protein